MGHLALVFLSPEAQVSFYGAQFLCFVAHSALAKLGPKRSMQAAPCACVECRQRHANQAGEKSAMSS